MELISTLHDISQQSIICFRCIDMHFQIQWSKPETLCVLVYSFILYLYFVYSYYTTVKGVVIICKFRWRFDGAKVYPSSVVNLSAYRQFINTFSPPTAVKRNLTFWHCRANFSYSLSQIVDKYFTISFAKFL